ncbi:MAG: protein tyrosine phosphatase family protein [Pseudomonadota bacterium]
MRNTIAWVVVLCVLGLSSAYADDTSGSHPGAYVKLSAIAKDDDIAMTHPIAVAGQPSAENFSEIAEAGYTVVVDMRGENENRGMDDEGAVVESLGMQYVAFPLVGGEAISWENAAKLHELLDEADGPVLLHCGSGNRVAALLALRDSQQGASDEEAIGAGRAAGLTSLEPLVRQRLAEKE